MACDEAGAVASAPPEDDGCNDAARVGEQPRDAVPPSAESGSGEDAESGSEEDVDEEEASSGDGAERSSDTGSSSEEASDASASDADADEEDEGEGEERQHAAGGAVRAVRESRRRCNDAMTHPAPPARSGNSSCACHARELCVSGTRRAKQPGWPAAVPGARASLTERPSVATTSLCRPPPRSSSAACRLRRQRRTCKQPSQWRATSLRHAARAARCVLALARRLACVAQIRVMRDRETGVNKGFAFVRYEQPEAASARAAGATRVVRSA